MREWIWHNLIMKTLTDLVILVGGFDEVVLTEHPGLELEKGIVNSFV
ncbi:hypothetical protein [uncultured Selenomonas sp.]|nr:hypothetical protein [uncultured Selenomonas sp.]